MNTTSEPTNLVLGADIDPQTPEATPMALIDAPRTEPEEQPPSFPWMPTLGLIAVGLGGMLAYAYL